MPGRVESAAWMGKVTTFITSLPLVHRTSDTKELAA